MEALNGQRLHLILNDFQLMLQIFQIILQHRFLDLFGILLQVIIRLDKIDNQPAAHDIVGAVTVSQIGSQPAA